MNIKERIRKMGPFIALVVTFIVIAALNDSFVDPNNLKNLLRQVSINALISFGMTFVILTGGIDLSVGSLLALSSAMMGSLIVSGMNPTTFAPMVSITREQMMTMFYGYAVYMDYNTMAVADLSAFPDGGDVSSWAEAEMGWAVANTLISGVKESDGVYLRPQGTATRAEAAAILHRFDQWRVNAVVTGK